METEYEQLFAIGTAQSLEHDLMESKYTLLDLGPRSFVLTW
jgi:hypothetical protein